MYSRMPKESDDTKRRFKGKVAFIRMGRSLPANSKVPQLLASIFPQQSVEVIDVSTLITKTHRMIDLVFVLIYYGVDILCGYKKIRRCMARTPYMFNKMKALIQRELAKETYLFSLQNQSLFDASTGRWPHFVYTDHTHLENLNYSGFGRKQLLAQAWISLEASIYQNATAVFTRSSNVSKSVIEKYAVPSEKVICVYAGNIVKVDDIKVNNASYSNKYWNKNILFVGLDWERKGGQDLLRAFEILLKHHPDATLTIVGSSPKDAAPNCNVIGRISAEDVNEYYERASVFCLRTKLEPFGLVFVEAMSHKLPIVGTRVGAIPDMVKDGENGFLVEVGDIVSLANALSELIGNPTKCQMYGNRSRQLALDQYSWSKVGEKIEQTILKHLSQDISGCR